MHTLLLAVVPFSVHTLMQSLLAVVMSPPFT
jgi:hypothetical protein